MREIPAIDANDYVTEIELDGDVYYLRMSWNSEGEFWVLGVQDYTRAVILAGVKVVPNVPLLAMFHHLAIPPGEIYAILMDDTRQVLLRSDFIDGTASLIYLEEGEDATL